MGCATGTIRYVGWYTLRCVKLLACLFGAVRMDGAGGGVCISVILRRCACCFVQLVFLLLVEIWRVNCVMSNVCVVLVFTSPLYTL